MITIVNSRRDIWGEKYPDIITRKSITDAAIQLVESEFKFNGKIIDITDLSLTTETNILSKIDTTEFRGSGKEIEFLHLLARWWLLISSDNEEYADSIVNMFKGKPLFITKFGDMIIGKIKSKNFIYLLVTELFQIEDSSPYKNNLLNLSFKDLFAIYDLINQGHILEDCMCLIKDKNNE
jgi:hypothetical protein